MSLHPAKTKQFIHEFEIIGEGNFLECVGWLRKGVGDAIHGPAGGILELDTQGCVVYRSRAAGESGAIYFSIHDYLGKWELLDFVGESE
ncbi:hypothetical protein M0R04_14965 [Candidatus Dojkabacteria bacterium]|jgi:hypothetical protein|nr:hypothetical protein [Candidatus Dojkabacteria bacterium]